MEAGDPLPDGSWTYRLAAGPRPVDPEAAAGDPEDPRARAHWIAARLDTARRAWARPLPAPVWMAILNLTPDSFSDGGRLLSGGGQVDGERVRAEAAAHAAEGAAWLDLGAESTRPGAPPVPAEVQLGRLLPALEAVQDLGPALSVDTRSATVAAACLAAGASMVNDVSALSDPEMAAVAAAAGARLVLMHMRGTPADMQRRCRYAFLLGQVADELAARVPRALAAGVPATRILLDPGFGFAKDAGQTLELLGRLDALRALGFPILAGPSRKSFLAAVLPGLAPAARDAATAGAAALCAARGAAILRLHRGQPAWDALRAAHAAGAAAHALDPEVRAATAAPPAPS